MKNDKQTTTGKALTVYKASAGSGKTFTLAMEYIKLLIDNPMRYKNILAVTFTNKATEEMKTRILSRLYGLSHRLEDSEDYMRCIAADLGMSPATVGERAARALKYILHDYGYFRVETIDSFFQSVMRNLARELDLAANMRIGLNDKQVKDLAVDTIIEELDKSSKVMRWIQDFILSNIAEDKKWNVIDDIKSFADQIFSDRYTEHSEAIGNKAEDDDFINAYIGRIKEIKEHACENLPRYADRFFEELEAAELKVTDLNGGKGTSGIAAYFEKLKSGKYDIGGGATLKKHLESADNWAAKSKSNYATVVAIAESRLKPLLEQTEKERSKQWKLFKSAEVTLTHLNKLRLLNSIEKKMREINEETNTFMLRDTPYMLHELIETSDAPFIFEKIGSNIDYIMIDEFQDTSKVQWKNFKVLLNETMSRGAGGNLIVGDVKQSIYRWRSGDWRLLNNITGQFDNAGEMLDIKTLDTNYRSERNIIEFNNAFFRIAADILFNEEKEIAPANAEQIVSAYADVEQKTAGDKPADGEVRMKFFPGKSTDDDILRELVAIIDELVEAGVSCNDIAIIVRTNENIADIAEFFISEKPNINLVSDMAYRLDRSLAVLTIVKAMYVLLHPNDILSKAELSKCYRRVLGEECLTMDADRLPLPDEFVRCREQLFDMPLSDLVERLYRIFGLSALNSQSAYMCAFNDCVTSFLQNYVADVGLFLERWEAEYHERTIPADNVDGVRITSIHKSKGLEFDNVIVPYCDWRLESGRNTLWCEAGVEPFNELPLVPLSYNKSLADTVYHDDYTEEHTQNSVDQLNLLYVAFTRAKKNLFVIGKCRDRRYISPLIENVLPKLADVLQGADYHAAPKPEKKKSRKQTEQPVADIVPAEPVTFRFGRLALPKNHAAEEKNDITHSQTVGNEDELNVYSAEWEPLKIDIETYDSLVGVRQSNESDRFVSDNDGDNKQEQYLDRGKIVHYVLSKIHTGDDIPAVLKAYKDEGLPYSDVITADEIESLLRGGMADERVSDWFSPHYRLFNECDIVYADNDGNIYKRRPDRVLTDGKRFIVVDYKTGTKRTAYRDQVSLYIDLLHSMGHTDVSGYLWYIDLNEIEEI